MSQPPRPSSRPGAPIAGHLVQPSPQVSPRHTNYHILELFGADESIGNLPVVDDGRPLGIINRNHFMSTMARPFHREIYGRKPCTEFMNKALVVDYHTPLHELSFQAVEAGDYVLADGFLVTDNGQLAGVGQGMALMQSLAKLQAEKHRQLMDSINYASVIQRSLLRSSRLDLQQSLADQFLVWEPRDVVGGDYYVFERHPDGFFLAMIDCTGHGVPGAFMTLIMASSLQKILATQSHQQPAALLEAINRDVKLALGQLAEGEPGHSSDEHSDDGMDAAFVWYNAEQRTLRYAGAKTPLFLQVPGEAEVREYTPSKKGVGYVDTPFGYQWEEQLIEVPAGSRLYLCTDGYTDQVGGPRRIAFGKVRFKEELQRLSDTPVAQQREALMAALARWQADHGRRDDLSLFGCTLP